MHTLYDSIKNLHLQMQTQHPLIVNITNHVTMDFVANGLLAIGASPVMSLAEEEADDLLSIANAMVLNIGTLNEVFLKTAFHFCTLANQKKVPLSLDPVGAGASTYRTKTCLDLLERFQFSLIRGNAGEIMALAGNIHKTRGVDSRVETPFAEEAAVYLSEKYPETVIAVSGEVDLLIKNGLSLSCHRGSPWMPRITGAGCLLTAVMAAFDVLAAGSLETARDAIFFYNICGEIAQTKAAGSGTFKTHFLDGLSTMPEAGDYRDTK